MFGQDIGLRRRGESANFDTRLSTSSSLSWSDEYENETSKEIFENLKRIDRVLKQQEECPSHYDKDEFSLWMRTFPNISIFDTPPSCDIKNNFLIVNGSTSRRNDRNAVQDRKRAVINSSEFSYNRLLSQRSANNHIRHFEDPSSNKSKNHRKITPVNKLHDTKLSAKSLKIHSINKDYTEFPQEFDSLPFIEIDEIFNEKRTLSSTFRTKKYKKLGKNNLLILPPIQGDRFRSISATPSQDKPSKFCLI